MIPTYGKEESVCYISNDAKAGLITSWTSAYAIRFAWINEHVKCPKFHVADIKQRLKICNGR